MTAGYLNVSSDDLCHEYRRSMQGGYFITEAVSIAITIVNMIIRTFNIFVVTKIGYWTLSKQTSMIVNTIFIATFINTALVLLFGNANFSGTCLHFWPFTMFNGAYTNMTQNWYLDIGPALISTMIFNSVYVYMDFANTFMTLFLMRALDQGGCLCCKKRKTKKTTIQSYINLYSGPPHSMNYKYSLILSTTFITFMYGVALPLLFPIAAFTFLNLLIMERILVTYWHSKPPMYDDKLNT